MGLDFESLLAGLSGMAYRGRNDADRTLEYASAGVEELTGHPLADFLSGRAAYGKLILPEDADRARQGLQSALAARRPYDLEYRIRTASGQLKWIWERGRGLPDGTLEGFAQDITVRREMDAKLRLLSSIMRGVSEAGGLEDSLRVVLKEVCEVTGWDFGQAWIPQGPCLRCASAWHARAPGLREFRRASEELTFEPGRGLPGRVWESRRPVWIPEVGQDARFERIGPAQKANLHAGVGIPVFVGGEVGAVIEFFLSEVREEDPELVRLIGGVADQLGIVLQRRVMEDALRTSEARLRRIVEAGFIGIVFWEADGRIVEGNDAFTSLVGYSREEIAAGRVKWAEMTPPEFADLDRKALEEIAARGVCTPFEKEYIRKDGQRVPILLGAASLDGNPDRGVAFVLDLTERKRLEDQLAQAHKMEGIGRLAGGIAHDFNNLLTSMLGHLDLAQGRLAPGHPARGDLDEVVRAATRTADLTRQLLAFSRKQVLQPRIIDLAAVVRGFQPLLQRTLGEHIELVQELAGANHTVKADPGQIEHVILNLAANARDAMPRGGTLRMRLEEVTHTSGREMPAGRYVLLLMSDTGMGMGKEQLAHLFEPFYTTKEVGQGTGLGLSTVYGIIRQSGGYVFAESERGRGTTFEIFLPKVDGVPESRAEAARPKAASETILLVEDEASVRKLSMGVLRAQGYRVVEAVNGQEALDLFGTLKDKVDLLLTDVVMPKVGGPDLARELRRRSPDLKVLYVSGYTREMLGQQGLVGATDSFLEKPYTPGMLTSKVRSVLDRKRDDPSSGSIPSPHPGPA